MILDERETNKKVKKKWQCIVVFLFEKYKLRYRYIIWKSAHTVLFGFKLSCLELIIAIYDCINNIIQE